MPPSTDRYTVSSRASPIYVVLEKFDSLTHPLISKMNFLLSDAVWGRDFNAKSISLVICGISDSAEVRWFCSPHWVSASQHAWPSFNLHHMSQTKMKDLSIIIKGLVCNLPLLICTLSRNSILIWVLSENHYAYR